MLGKDFHPLSRNDIDRVYGPDYYSEYVEFRLIATKGDKRFRFKFYIEAKRTGSKTWEKILRIRSKRWLSKLTGE